MTAVAVSWWCSGGSGLPWSWRYQPYVGVWLLAAVLTASYVAACRRWQPVGTRGLAERLHRRQTLSFAAGVLTLIVASDWPLGPLGAGYLASIAMLRFLLISFVAAPLLLLGIPLEVTRRLLTPRPVKTLARAVTGWPVAFGQFNIVLVVTHLPPVVDNLKTFQAGSFALDMAWLVSGLIMWLPVISGLPELPGLRDPARMLYLFGLSILPTVPASFLTFSDFPLYRLYELAPSVWFAYDTVTDQRVAGLTMKIGGGLILWAVIACLFFRWADRERRGGAGHLAWDINHDLDTSGLRR